MFRFKKTFLLIGVGTVFIAAYGVTFAWFQPAGSPPNRNVAAPMNLGESTQTKDGDLLVDQSLAYTDVRAPKYCDLNGKNCLGTSTTELLFTSYVTQATNGAVNNTNGGECACLPGDLLSDCSGYQSSDNNVTAEMRNGKIQCSSQAGDPVCTCLTVGQ